MQCSMSAALEPPHISIYHVCTCRSAHYLTYLVSISLNLNITIPIFLFYPSLGQSGVVKLST